MSEKKILIVENETMLRNLLRTILEVAGYKIIDAADGNQGCKLAKETIPDLILVKIEMPGIDGIETLRMMQLEPLTKDIPVLALSFYDSASYKETLLKKGFKDVIRLIHKPADIVRTVQSFLSPFEQNNNSSNG